MKRDHRQDYTPAQMFAAGSRMMDDYEPEHAVSDYQALHPLADAMGVWEELMSVLSRRDRKRAEAAITALTAQLSPFELWRRCQRLAPGWSMEDAVLEYSRYHPRADLEAVRAELVEGLAEQHRRFGERVIGSGDLGIRVIERGYGPPINFRAGGQRENGST